MDGQTYTETTGYDTGGRQLWVQYPSGDQIGTPASPWTYDGSGELLAIPSLISGITYNARGQATQLTRVNGVVTNYSYSAARGWLLGLTTQLGSNSLQSLGYTRDAHGRITASSSDATGESWSYGYDDLDRLTQATNTGNSLLSQSLTYDSVDNMTSNSAVGSYTYPVPGSARPHAVQTAGSTSYGYDADGNMITAGGDSFTYDGLNRLTLTNGTSFLYGPDGARWKKTSGGATTLYLGDDIEIAGGAATEYLPGDAVRTGGATYWLHRDNLGSVRLSTDGTGSVVQRAFYLPYGERQQTNAGLVTSKGFIGWDPLESTCRHASLSIL